MSEVQSKVQMRAVSGDEAGLRLDRWFQRHFPELTHAALQKLLRTGQVRIDGKRAEGKDLDGRVRRRAREVARKLAGGSAQEEQVKSLRDAVEKLQDENRELKERMMKLEARK